MKKTKLINGYSFELYEKERFTEAETISRSEAFYTGWMNGELVGISAISKFQ